MKTTDFFVMLVLTCLFLAFSFLLTKQEYYGNVEKMPEGGIIGEWVVGGHTVIANKDTKFKEDQGKLHIGAYVEVEGAEKNGKFIASEIETKIKK
jgi:hypothetical protein